MKPGNLLRFCARCIAHSFMDSIQHVVITENIDKDRLTSALAQFLERYRDILFSNVIQDQLYQSLIFSLRNHHNPALYFTAMLVLCSKVTVDQIAIVEDINGLPPLEPGTGLDITAEECFAIIDVLNKLRAIKVKKGWSNISPALPSTSLVLEGVYFHDPGFLPSLFSEMPHLRQIELQYNGTPYALRALSKHCQELESMSFLEPQMKVSVLEIDVLPILFGIPPPENQKDLSTFITRFAEDEDFRSMFIIQYPNLKKLNLDELFLEEDFLHDVYTLVLLLYPKLTCFGKHTGLTRNILSKYRRLWTIKNEQSYSHISLNLTKAKVVDRVFDFRSDSQLELKYIEDVLPMFKSLKSIELQRPYWSENEVGRFCNAFSSQVKAISLIELPIGNMSCLSSFTHLRLPFKRRISFSQVHLILDNCVHLQTLSLHSVFLARDDGNRNQPLQNLDMFLEHDNHILENWLVEDLAQQMQDLQVFFGEAQEVYEGNPHAAPGNNVLENPIPHMYNYKKNKYQMHFKLSTLRIASLIEASREPAEAFLLGLLERLPNLQNLCFGKWMGGLSTRREHVTCTGNTLVSVIASSREKKPLLPELQQLCCLPSGSEREIRASLQRLAEALPSLHTIVLPSLELSLIGPSLRYFKNSNIEIRHKCATDHVFFDWDPDH